MAKLVAQGLGYADNNGEIQSYHRSWPSAYELERMICASGGDCKASPALPQDQGETAWLAAKNQVSQYFKVKPVAASASH